jgi:hypothetical protein
MFILSFLECYGQKKRSGIAGSLRDGAEWVVIPALSG